MREEKASLDWASDRHAREQIGGGKACLKR